MITINRTTKETDISIQLAINSVDKSSEINTGLPFFDHMLDQLATHADWNLIIQVEADYQVDDHHGIEDVAICLGQAVFKAWNAQSNIRYGQRLLPMDECLTMCAISDSTAAAVSHRPGRVSVLLSKARASSGSVAGFSEIMLLSSL